MTGIYAAATFFILLVVSSFSQAGGSCVAGGGGSFCEVLDSVEKTDCQEKLDLLWPNGLKKRIKLKEMITYRREFAFFALQALSHLRYLPDQKVFDHQETLLKAQELINTFYVDEKFSESPHRFILENQITDEDGKLLTAYNKIYQKSKGAAFEYEIILNPYIWDASVILAGESRYTGLVKQALALHEFLSLLRVESSKIYEISQLLIENKEQLWDQMDPWTYAEGLQIAGSSVRCRTGDCPGRSIHGVALDIPLEDMKLSFNAIYDFMANRLSIVMPDQSDMRYIMKEYFRHVSFPRELNLTELAGVFSKSWQQRSYEIDRLRHVVSRVEKKYDLSCQFQQYKKMSTKRPASKMRQLIYSSLYTCEDRQTLRKSLWSMAHQRGRKLYYFDCLEGFFFRGKLYRCPRKVRKLARRHY